MVVRWATERLSKVKKGENKTNVKYGVDFERIIAKTWKTSIKDIGCLMSLYKFQLYHGH